MAAVLSHGLDRPRAREPPEGQPGDRGRRLRSRRAGRDRGARASRLAAARAGHDRGLRRSAARARGQAARHPGDRRHGGPGAAPPAGGDHHAPRMRLTSTPSARPRPGCRRRPPRSSRSARRRPISPSARAHSARCVWSIPTTTRCRTASPASARSAARPCSAATGGRPRSTPRISAAAGSTWATCSSGATTAASISSTAPST